MINTVPDAILGHTLAFLDQTSQEACRLISKRFEAVTTASMETLDLSEKAVDFRRLKPMTLRMERLKRLILSHAPKPPRSLTHLTGLNVLWIDHVTEGMLIAFPPNITELNVSGRVTNDLSFLCVLKKLRLLIARDSGLSDEDVTYLQENCPGIRFDLEGCDVSLFKLLELKRLGKLCDLKTTRSRHLNMLTTYRHAVERLKGVSNPALLKVCQRFSVDGRFMHPLDCSARNIMCAANYVHLPRAHKLALDFIFKSWKGSGRHMRALTRYFRMPAERQLRVKKYTYTYIHNQLISNERALAWARNSLFLNPKAFSEGVRLEGALSYREF